MHTKKTATTTPTAIREATSAVGGLYFLSWDCVTAVPNLSVQNPTNESVLPFSAYMEITPLPVHPVANQAVFESALGRV